MFLVFVTKLLKLHFCLLFVFSNILEEETLGLYQNLGFFRQFFKSTEAFVLVIYIYILVAKCRT